MRGQWSLILGLLAAIVIAIFAVINVDGVRVNYLFGTAEWPLILVILGSVLMGAVIAGALGMVKIYRLQAELKRFRTAGGLSPNTVADNELDPQKQDEEDSFISERSHFTQPISETRYKKKSE